MVVATDRRKRLRRQKVRRKIKLYSFSFLGIVFLVAIIWVIFFSSLFKIKQIVLSGEDLKDKITLINFVNVSIENKSWLGLNPSLRPWLAQFFYNNKNSLFQDFVGLGNSLKENFQEYSDSQINFNWWKQTLNIVVSKRGPVALWCDDNHCGLVDGNGIYFEAIETPNIQTILNDPLYADYPVLKGQLKGVTLPINIGTSLVSPETMARLGVWYNSCRGSVIAFREIFLNETSLECFSAETVFNTKLTFNFQGDIDKIILVVENLQNKTKSKTTWQGLTSLNFCFYPKIYYTPDNFFSF